MEFTYEEFLEAVRLAESLARSELQLEDLEKLMGENSPVVADSKKRLEIRREQVRHNELAEKFLPQSRKIVRMKEERKKAIEEKAILGQLSQALFYLTAIESGEITDDGKLPFEDEELNPVWLKFVSSLKEGNKIALLEELLGLLSVAKAELLYQDLPSLPPRYVKPEDEDMRELNEMLDQERLDRREQDFLVDNDCLRCLEHVSVLHAYCMHCGFKNSRFDEAFFAAEWGMDLSGMKSKICDSGHAEALADYPDSFQEDLPYCFVCGVNLMDLLRDQGGR